MILFSNNCPKCKIIKQMLDRSNIDYELCFDFKEVIDQGITTMPVLKIDGKYLDFNQAVDYLKSLELSEGKDFGNKH